MPTAIRLTSAELYQGSGIGAGPFLRPAVDNGNTETGHFLLDGTLPGLPNRRRQTTKPSATCEKEV